MKIFVRLFLAVFLLVVPLSRVSNVFAEPLTGSAAQQTGSLVLSAPDTASFPAIQFRLDAYDAQGDALSGLRAQDAVVLEDQHSVRPASIQQVTNNLQVIVALNLGPVMAKQVEGVQGYQLVQQALVNWTQKNLASGDDFSLATPTGLYLIRERDREKVVKGLQEYSPDLPHAQPALGSLAEALDLATDPLDHSSTKHAILYITPSLPPSANSTIADLTKRARGVGVRINIWQIAEPSGSTTANPNNPFELMAEATGGRFEEIVISPQLPEIEPLFQPLRSSYLVQYTSEIQKSGTHSLQVQVKQTGMTLVSVENNFNLSVQPPNPIFLSPPATIQRYWDTAKKGVAPLLMPETVALQIMVEFPDQHRRALKATRLYVDDKLIAENTSEPFDRFTWSLANETASAQKLLRVEVVDILDLSGKSSDLPLEIQVDQPAKANLTEDISTRGMIAIGAVAAAGLVLALVMILTSSQRRARQKRQPADRRLGKDPVTQPVQISQEHTQSRPRQKPGQEPAKKAPQQKNAAAKTGTAHTLPTWSNAIWSRGSNSNIPARLVALDENEQPITGGAIPLARQEITFGTDPQRATQVLNSSTVNELHARLYRDTEGDFFLADQNSIAGTWINYAPVNSSGARLEHGDLIHIGKVMFRFELTNPAQADIRVIDLDQLP